LPNNHSIPKKASKTRSEKYGTGTAGSKEEHAKRTTTTPKTGLT
jgi:hypothetical protein